jgi:DNA invertase Pin-like site-specific DNA recombinase
MCRSLLARGAWGRMRRGYAHQLTDEADLDAQVAALSAWGCDEMLVERELGEPARLRLDEYLYNLVAGDELAVVRLDIFGRSTGKLVVILEAMMARGVVVTVLEPSPLTLAADRSPSGSDLIGILARHEETRMEQRYRTGATPRNVRRRRLDSDQTAEALRRFRAGESIAAIGRALSVEPRIVNHALGGLRKRGESLTAGGGVRMRPTSLGAERPFEITRRMGEPDEP